MWENVKMWLFFPYSAWKRQTQRDAHGNNKHAASLGQHAQTFYRILSCFFLIKFIWNPEARLFSLHLSIGEAHNLCTSTFISWFLLWPSFILCLWWHIRFHTSYALIPLFYSTNTFQYLMIPSTTKSITCIRLHIYFKFWYLNSNLCSSACFLRTWVTPCIVVQT